MQQVKKVFVFFGPPGSGKGTLAQRYVKEECRAAILSMGDVCRKHMNTGTPLGKDLEKILNKGILAPDSLVIRVAQDFFETQVGNADCIILDGFPRTKSQAVAFYDMLEQYGFVEKLEVIVFDISDAKVVERIANRLVCTSRDCQRVYSQLNSQHPQVEGVCDICGGRVSKRSDDSEQVVTRRLESFAHAKDDVLKYYAEQNVLVKHIKVEEMTADDVFCWFMKLASCRSKVSCTGSV